MPSRTPASPGRIPRGTRLLVLRLRRLPERKVPHVLLVVIVGRHTRAGLNRAGVESRKPPVSAELRDRVIDRAIVRAVCEPALHEALDDPDHLRDVLRRLR